VRHLQHTRDVRAFMVSLAGAARHYRALRFDHALMVWDESECRQYYRVSGEPRALIPDSGGVYRIGPDSFEFLLEIDRGTMSRRKLARKFDSYYSFRQTGEYVRGGMRLPQLLVVVPDEGRAHVIRQVILARAHLAGLTPLDAWIAVQETLDVRGPAAPVWRHIVDWTMRCCFTGFENVDQLPRSLNLAQLSREVKRDMSRARTIRTRRKHKSGP
jgi:Replication-relaxation